MLYSICSIALGTEEQTIPEVGERLMTFTDVITRLMLVACFVVGVGFIFVALLQYQTHRRNPKFVPLDKPVWYLVLGIILIGIIFLEEIFGGGTGSILKLKQHETQQGIHNYQYNIDAPIEHAPHR
jgi:hypothetical protein